MIIIVYLLFRVSRNVKIFPTTISVLRLGLSYFDFDVLSNFMAKNLGQINVNKT